MFNALTGLGWGVVTFAITIGVGTIVLTKFSGAIADCPADKTYNETGSTGYCSNETASEASGSTGTITTNYLNTQLGTSGLAGWTPAIIAFAVGMLFLGGFLINRGGGRKY